MASRASGNTLAKPVPAVDHILPRLVRDLGAGGPGAFREEAAVVKQDLGGADLDQERRQAAEFAVKGRGERGSGIGSV